MRSGRAGARPHLVQIPAARRSACWRRLRSRSYSRVRSRSRRGLPSARSLSGAGAVGGAALLQAGFAERAIRRGLGLAAIHAQSRRAALSGALVEAFEIAPAACGDVAASHGGLLAADAEKNGRTARRRRAGRTSGEAAVSTLLEERGRVGSERLGWLHDAVPFVPVRENGGRTPPPDIHPPPRSRPSSSFRRRKRADVGSIRGYVHCTSTLRVETDDEDVTGSAKEDNQATWVICDGADGAGGD